MLGGDPPLGECLRKPGGKGKSALHKEPAERETGVLRRSVPHWLRTPDIQPLVIGFEQAGAMHGGTGALYIRLRRHDRFA